MKKSTLTKAGASILSFSLAFAMPTYAAQYSVSQADFDAAIGGTATKNITCTTGAESYCTANGDYTLTENVDITSTHTTTVNYQLRLSGESSLDLGGKTLTTGGITTEDNTKATIKNGEVSAGTSGGSINPKNAELTLSDVTATDMAIMPTSSTLNIESGTYSSTTAMSVLYTGTDSTVNISGGTFSTTNDGMIPVMQANNWDDSSEVTLNITGGTFTSASGAAIDFSNEPADPTWGVNTGMLNANISGGTFTGKTAGIVINDPSLNTIKLSGGTYKYTGTDNNSLGAIAVFGDNAAAINGFLASGYHYSDPNTSTKSPWGGTITVVEGPTSVVADNSGNNTTDPTESTSSTTSSTKKSGIKAPDTGAFTSEGESASATSSLLTFATIITLLGFVAYKKFSKRS